MSLSKVGLPGIRTGIVIAREEIISAVSTMNAVMHFFVSSVGVILLHKNECLRMTYSQEPETVAAGIRIIAEEPSGL